MRIHYLSLFMSTVDVTWLMGPVFIWSTIEPSVAVVCACLPHLAPLVRLASRSISSSFHSQKSTTATSRRRHRRNSGPGHGLQTHNIFGNRGTTFDYGLDQMKKTANDDEIGLTNYVTVDPDGVKHPSIESISEDNVHDHSITVQSSFVQATSSRPFSQHRKV